MKSLSLIKQCVVFMVFASFSLCAMANKPLVTVEQAWSPAAPPNMMMHAGYLVLKNVSNKTLEIEGFTSTFYKSVSLHDMSHENGIHKMVEIDVAVLAPNETLTLSPGGKHLMLMGPNGPRRDSDQIPITIKIKNEESLDVNLLVKRR